MKTPKQTNIQLKGRSRAFTGEPDESDRNREICQGNQEIGDGVEPDKAGIPEIAEAVRLKITRTEKLPQEIQESPAATLVAQAP